MVEFDYGKLSYIKYIELEKRIKELESKSSETAYKKLNFEYVNQAGEDTANKEFLLDVFKEDKYTLDLLVYVRGNDPETTYSEVYINGIKVDAKKVDIKTDFTYSFDCVLEKGKNKIEIVITSSIETPILEVAKLNISGAVDYSNVKNHLTYVTYLASTFIVHLVGNKAILYRYTVEGLKKQLVLNDVCDCKICGNKQNYIYICYIDAKKSLKTCVYNYQTKEVLHYYLGVEGVSSVAGVPYGDGFKIYYSRLAKIYCGEYLEGEEFKPYFTGRKGFEVYADAMVEDAVIIVDNLLNAKLVTV